MDTNTDHEVHAFFMECNQISNEAQFLMDALPNVKTEAVKHLYQQLNAIKVILLDLNDPHSSAEDTYEWIGCRCRGPWSGLPDTNAANMSIPNKTDTLLSQLRYNKIRTLDAKKLPTFIMLHFRLTANGKLLLTSTWIYIRED
ncbi:hypothetical protein K438DRAFT_1764824 [Mycena galopus ATCC 62051]|nr:hypothetical protein K438DRAFT_1764824 [Mycena galopus ATCC 62051]